MDPSPRFCECLNPGKSRNVVNGTPRVRQAESSDIRTHHA